MRAHLAAYHNWRGELAAARDIVAELKSRREALGPSPQVVVLSYLVEATYALHAGLHEECLSASTSGLQAAQKSGVHLWDVVLAGHGVVAALSSNDLRKADTQFARMELLARQLPTADDAYLSSLAFWREYLAGDIPSALHHADMADRLTRQRGVPYFIAACEAGRALLLHRAGMEVEAARALEAAAQIASAECNPYLEWVALLFKALIAMDARGDGEEASELAAAMRTGARHGYVQFFFWLRADLARLCARALQGRIEVEYVKGLINLHHLPAPAPGPAREAWPWPVRIHALGAFSVEVKGVELHFDGKVPRGPLNLLKVLIAFGGRKVKESTVATNLWPDADGDAAEQSLATTLFRLRKLIGHDVVTRQDGMLTLDPDICWIDCQEIDLLMSNRRGASVDSLNAVLGLCKEPFLAGEEDAPWSIPYRERLHVKIVAGLRDLARWAESHASSDSAISLYRQGLALDDLVEDFYRGLMRCHANRGELSEAASAYTRCQRVPMARLSVEPSAETRRLHARILGGVSV